MDGLKEPQGSAGACSSGAAAQPSSAATATAPTTQADGQVARVFDKEISTEGTLPLVLSGRSCAGFTYFTQVLATVMLC